MHVAEAGDQGEASAANPLLQEQVVVQAQPVGRVNTDDGVVIEIRGQELTVEDSVLVFEFVAQCGRKPAAWGVVALVGEAGDVDVGEILEIAIQEVPGGHVTTAAGVDVSVFVESPMAVLEA